MNISVTFRHLEASDAIRAYAEDKVSKLQKFLRQPLRARVTLSLDKLQHSAEVQISSGGEHLEAHDTTEDMYASIDKVIDKLERQINDHKNLAQDRKRRGTGLNTVPPSDPAASAEPMVESPASLGPTA